MKKYRTVTIKVTNTSIRKGIQGKAHYCPIARACHAAGLRGARIDDGVNLSDGGRIKLPRRIVKWIKRFDNDRRKVKPFTFKMRVPLSPDATF